jgi:hypothetical protein
VGGWHKKFFFFLKNGVGVEVGGKGHDELWEVYGRVKEEKKYTYNSCGVNQERQEINDGSLDL